MGATVASLVIGWTCLTASADGDFNAVASTLKGEDVLAHIRTLASDAFEGRGPGTPGEVKTVDYLVDQFKSMGLRPGNPDGRYVQDVPLVGFQATSTAGAIRVGPATISLKSQDDWI
ncbi:MAG TPA: hypothetical protein VGH33_15045, partial [Isosphaeraceae bacterium]